MAGAAAGLVTVENDPQETLTRLACNTVVTHARISELRLTQGGLPNGKACILRNESLS
jgi:hypothetical protein